MYLPPEQRQPGYPPRPARGGISKRGEAVLLWLVGIFLVSILLAPIGGSTVVQALLALAHR